MKNENYCSQNLPPGKRYTLCPIVMPLLVVGYDYSENDISCGRYLTSWNVLFIYEYKSIQWIEIGK